MLERAIMARTRFITLPIVSSAYLIFAEARNNPTDSWFTLVYSIMQGGHLPRVILDIHEHPLFSGDQLALARQDREYPRVLLKDFEWSVVRPVLFQYDFDVFLAAASVNIHTF